ncbi:MAG: hypothetical protein ACYT04_82435, partial [Nostoc sp.]
IRLAQQGCNLAIDYRKDPKTAADTPMNQAWIDKNSYIPMAHILHLALAIRNRGYTNKVHFRGLRANQGFCF